MGVTRSPPSSNRMSRLTPSTSVLIVAPDIGQLDGLRESLAATSAGRKVELVSANNIDGGIEGRLRIGGSS